MIPYESLRNTIRFGAGVVLTLPMITVAILAGSPGDGWVGSAMPRTSARVSSV